MVDSGVSAAHTGELPLREMQRRVLERHGLLDNPFIAALRERVLVFDGAFGTWVQARDLTADDFGGASLEGCNEHLVLTRPDEIAAMHGEFFEAGVDAVETATFGSFA